MGSPSTEADQAGRVYGGLTAEERRERRRDQLIDAGIELFGTRGVKGTSIRAIAKQSGLIQRYFHESFTSVDDLFGAVLERLQSEIFAETSAAVIAAGDNPDEQIRAGLRAFIVATTRDPRYARIKLLEESSVNYRLEAHRREVVDGMVDFIASRAPRNSQLDARVLAIGVVGAIEQILKRWYHGELDLTLDEFVDHSAALFLAVERAMTPAAGAARRPRGGKAAPTRPGSRAGRVGTQARQRAD